jgi:hypothetical protein
VDDACADLSAWRAGEAAALERLVRGVTPVLWQLARANGLDRRGAEQVVRATWTEFLRRPARLGDPRAALRELTAATRRRAWLLARTGDAAHRVDAFPQLPERCRRMLRMLAFEERPDPATLAGHLGLRPATFVAARRRCLDRMRALLLAGPSGPHVAVSDQALLAQLRAAWQSADPAPGALAGDVLGAVRRPRQPRTIRVVDTHRSNQTKSQ